jgi:hypothetical protein
VQRPARRSWRLQPADRRVLAPRGRRARTIAQGLPARRAQPRACAASAARLFQKKTRNLPVRRLFFHSQCDAVRTRWCIRPKNGAEKFISKAILERCPMHPSGLWTLCLCFVSCTAIPLFHVSHLPLVYPACHFFNSTARPHVPFPFSPVRTHTLHALSPLSVRLFSAAMTSMPSPSGSVSFSVSVHNLFYHE